MGSLTSRPTRPADEEAASAGQIGAQSFQRGLYFGPHFVLGGQRFAAAGPESFLFGGLASDLAPLSNFAMNRMAHPLPDIQSTTTVRSHVNLKKNTLHLIKKDGEDQKLGLEFRFDCDKDCSVSIYYVAKETVENNSVVIVPAHEGSTVPPQPFSMGIDQTFRLSEEHFLDVSKFSQQELVETNEEEFTTTFPIIILLEAKTEDSNPKNVQSQATFASLIKSGTSYDLKVIKQKIMVDGVSYILQEIFGIEHTPESDPSTEDGVENTRECVVCMSDPKDTIALPCRHLCLCSQCAEQLRFQSNKCPICRQPYHSLLQIKIGEPKEAPEATPQPSAEDALSQPKAITLVIDEGDGFEKGASKEEPEEEEDEKEEKEEEEEEKLGATRAPRPLEEEEPSMDSSREGLNSSSNDTQEEFQKKSKKSKKKEAHLEGGEEDPKEKKKKAKAKAKNEEEMTQDVESSPSQEPSKKKKKRTASQTGETPQTE